MDQGDLPASRTDLYRCSVCGTAWSIGRRVQLPYAALYDPSNDLFEHPCPACAASQSTEELERTHRQRYRDLR